LIFIVLFSFMQEHHYVDGMEFLLTDGNRIMTLSEVKTDLYNYFWYEDGAYVTIPKSMILKVDYFTFRELGRAPKLKTKNIHQRRIRGSSVVYQSDGKKKLRVLHVQANGLSIEGMVRFNKVHDLRVVSGESEHMYYFNLELAKPDSLLEFHFYDMRGRAVTTAIVDLEMFPMSKKEKKKHVLSGFFRLSSEYDPESFGLVEVLSNHKKSGGSEHD